MLDRGKSKAAFGRNVKTEMAAGKPQKQLVAIAYSEQRRPKGSNTLAKVIAKRK